MALFKVEKYINCPERCRHGVLNFQHLVATISNTKRAHQQRDSVTTGKFVAKHFWLRARQGSVTGVKKSSIPLIYLILSKGSAKHMGSDCGQLLADEQFSLVRNQ